MNAKHVIAAAVGVALSAHPVLAADLVVQMHLVNSEGIGASMGMVTISENPEGLVFSPKLTNMAPGVHGFHVHEYPDCGPAMKDATSTPGLAAGGHYDPAASGKHEGPEGAGHLGDLPVLTVATDGTATAAVVAPRLKLADVLNRSLMIHAGSDNYADTPAPLGGGGARVACGVIK